jgi:hypothetical protein
MAIAKVVGHQRAAMAIAKVTGRERARRWPSAMCRA